jgi:hypothetical protein
MVIVPAGIIEEGKTGKIRPYTEHLSKKAGAGEIPPAPTGESILLLESVFFALMLVLTVFCFCCRLFPKRSTNNRRYVQCVGFAVNAFLTLYRNSPFASF